MHPLSNAPAGLESHGGSSFRGNKKEFILGFDELFHKILKIFC